MIMERDWIDEIIDETIQSGFTLVTPSDDWKTVSIGNGHAIGGISLDEVAGILLSLGVSMYEKTGLHYDIDIELGLLADIKLGVCNEVRRCKYDRPLIH